MDQCYFIIQDQVDYVTAHNNCSQVNGNLLFTKTQLGWDNLIKYDLPRFSYYQIQYTNVDLFRSGWDIYDQMWFGLTYDSNTESYSFDDNSPYSFNGSFYIPWQSTSEAQNPNTYYGYSDMYCVQVQKTEGILALFVTPCTNVASAVCLIGTLESKYCNKYIMVPL